MCKTPDISDPVEAAAPAPTLEQVAPTTSTSEETKAQEKRKGTKAYRAGSLSIGGIGNAKTGIGIGGK